MDPVLAVVGSGLVSVFKKCATSDFAAGIVGNLLASIGYDHVAKNPVAAGLARLRDLAGSGVTPENHDLLRALWMAQNEALVLACEHVLKVEKGLRPGGLAIPVSEKLAEYQVWLSSLTDAETRALLALRTAAIRHARQATEGDLKPILDGLAVRLAQAPDLFGLGSEFAPEVAVADAGDQAKLREQATEQFITQLRHLQPEGLSSSLEKCLRARWFDYLRLAFREVLKRYPNAKTAFEFRIWDRIEGLPIKLDEVLRRLEHFDWALDQLHQQLRWLVEAVEAVQQGINAQHAQNLEDMAALHALIERDARVREAESGLTAILQRLDQKLDYAIAGFPIQPFAAPEPPEHERELLQAKHRAVDLVGRETDLASLWQWLFAGKTVAARLIVGGAGTGKTRLAFELLLRVNRELPAWRAGIVSGSALRTFDETKQPTDWAWASPTLLIVDYAQTLAVPLAKLLGALTSKRREKTLPPLRVLLLDRFPGEWFDGLLRLEEGLWPCAVGKLFDPPEPVPLTPLPAGRLRRQVLAQTLAKAAELNRQPALRLPPEGDPDFERSLAREIFAEPLNLMLAALAASELGLTNALTRTRVDLALTLAAWERRRLRKYTPVPDDEAQARILHHLAACATLERGFTPTELDRAVKEELAALQLNWSNGSGDLASVLRRALPGDRLAACATLERGFTPEELDCAVKEELAALQLNWSNGSGDLASVLRRALPSDHLAIAPIEPDFLGEAFILDVLARPEPSADRWRPWCQVITRCCRRDAQATPATLLHAFQNFGRRPEYAEPLLAATDALIRAGVADGEPGLLLGIEAALPHQTVELRSRAAEVTRRLYDQIKAALNHGREELKPEVARLANNLANRFSELGRRAEALVPAQEAVDLRRALAGQNPDAFNPDLAMSLNNLANRLNALGRRAEALVPAQEGVDLYRALARQNPDLFNPDLARSLNTLANRLSELGRQPDAVGPAQEAVDLHRALAGQNPDAFNPDLARSLNNLATFLSALGRRAEALGRAQEAVDLFRTLARQNPDAFNPDLAGSLNNLAAFLSAVGRRAEALGLAQAAVDLFRALARQNPDAFNPGLARSLNNLANRLSELGRRAEALGPAQEAVDLFRALARRNPDAFNPTLASSLNNLANVLSELGRRAEALGQAQEAVDLRRTLAGQIPDAFNPALAMSLNNLAAILSALGRRAEALGFEQEAAELRSALALSDPNANVKGS